jgi:dienelactone hydrolase
MLGAYGDLAEGLLSADPRALSFRRPEFREVEAWRDQARAQVAELLAAPEVGTPEPEVVEKALLDGLEATRLRWHLLYGPATEALLLRPHGVAGALPGVLALHDHGGLKYFGWRKVADDGAPVHAVVRALREEAYGGRAWANALARRGYVVLCHDVFLWGSRRIRLADVPERVRWNGAVDPKADTEQEVRAYNDWASAYENLVAKSLLSAGTTLPGVILAEDQTALGVLCAQPETDPQRVACAGLSGGGLRTVYLAGMDARIHAAACVGLMSTWRDPIFHQCDHWTWMMFAPRLPRFLEWTEVLGMHAPAPVLVQNNSEDQLFTLAEMQRADGLLREVYAKAGAAERYACQFYPGGHKFDRQMQEEAFDWLDGWLKA